MLCCVFLIILIPILNATDCLMSEESATNAWDAVRMISMMLQGYNTKVSARVVLTIDS